MTTKTQDLKAKLASLTPEDTQKATAFINSTIGTVSVIALMIKARRAVKRSAWNEATYYAVAIIGAQAGLRYRLDDMRRKSFIK